MTKEELKQEAEEYVKQNYCEMCVMADDCKSGCIDCFTVQAYIAGAEPREKWIAELEKENAKLQGLINQYKASKCGSISLVNQNMVMFDQLTKAKELLKQWLQTSKASSCDNINIVTDTEQFISEVEK